jgi:endoglucanase
MFRTFVLACTAAVLTACSSAPAVPPAARAPASPTSAWAVAAAMNPGWNLGNTLEGIPNEGDWGNPPATPVVFDRIKGYGFKSVRVPVNFHDHIGPGPDYTISPAWLKRVETVTDWATDRGLYTVLDFHHWWKIMDRFQANPEANTAKLVKIWTQIAAALKDKGPLLLFETINEPGSNEVDNDATAAEINQLNFRVLAAIRATGGNNSTRNVLLPCRNTDTNEAAKTMEIPANDPHVVVTFHYYSPWSFVSGSQATWGSATEWEYLVTQFRAVHDRWITQGIPVIIGEFGALTQNQSYYRSLYIDAVVAEARKNRFTTMLWDNGEWFQRLEDRWSDPSLVPIIRAATDGTPNSFVKTDDLYVVPGQEPVDAPVALGLNGNTLTSVVLGPRTLTPGTDYTTSGESVTLKAAAVKDLLSQMVSSPHAAFEFRFSRGAPAYLKAALKLTPVIQQAEVTVVLDVAHGDMKVPADFKGMRVATMVAQAYDQGKKTGVPRNLNNGDLSYDDNTKKLTLSGQWLLDKTFYDTLVTFTFAAPGVTCSLWLKVVEE